MSRPWICSVWGYWLSLSQTSTPALRPPPKPPLGSVQCGGSREDLRTLTSGCLYIIYSRRLKYLQCMSFSIHTAASYCSDSNTPGSCGLCDVFYRVCRANAGTFVETAAVRWQRDDVRQTARRKKREAQNLSRHKRGDRIKNNEPECERQGREREEIKMERDEMRGWQHRWGAIIKERTNQRSHISAPAKR